jgi:putative hemolysin
VVNKSNVFSIRPKGQSLSARAIRGFAPLIEHAMGLDLWNQRYVHCGQAETPREFIRRVFESFRVHWRVRESDVARIPRTGPLIVVANHPFGAMEGLFLADLLLRVRPDSKLLVNYLLSRIPNLRDVFFFVDPFGGPAAAKANLAGTKQAIRHVKDGGVLGVFPAGEVSSFNLRTMTVTDKTWNPSIGRIIQATGAPVLPVFFEGQNSPFFHAAGMLHPRLRTVLLAREMIGKSGQKLGVRVGSVIPHRRLKEFEDAGTLIDFLRQRTYLLQHRPAPAPKRRRRRRRLRRIPLSIRRRRVLTKVPETIIPPVAIESIRAEVDALPVDQWLSKSEDFAVIHADAAQIPSLLREIGRLREITFRATGEGTGKSIDLDRFDEYYVHLFVWDRKERQLVGAYRMGQSDKILPTMGMGGLYTATLFLYDAKLLRKISPALELGRSFVKDEYQKSYGPLLMLWRGIAAYATKHPKYRYVFGPVSISNTYQTVSKSLMVEFLKNHHSPQQLSELVMARNPFRPSRLRGLDLRHGYATFETDDLSDLVSDIEPDQKGMPVLLRQYLKLGAKLLAFNVDPDFGDCVDGLIVVDLAADNISLDRYFDKATRRQYQARHGVLVEDRSAG